MRINHNSTALNASDHFAAINKNIAKSMKRLSSGTKITSPADDAAGLAISTKLDAQIKGLKRAALNSNDGISVIQAAEGGLEEMHSVLGRMRELAVEAANDALSEEDRDAVQEEIKTLIDELDQITDTTAFNGEKLLNGNLSRRSLTHTGNVHATYISTEVPVGQYVINVTAAAEQAVYQTGFSSSGAVVTKEQEGAISVNGFDVHISEGMTSEDVFRELQVHLSKIGIDVFSSPNGEDVSDFSGGDPVYFKTKEYGTAEKIEIKVENDALAALLGVTDGDLETGKDCEISLPPYDPEGTSGNTQDFSTTASATTNGNEIIVVDRKGFEMHFSAEPQTTGEAVMQVLSAGTMAIQVGANSGEQLNIDIPKLDAEGLGVDTLYMYTHELAANAVELIDKATEKVSSARSALGAYENRLEDIYDSLGVQEESVTEAYSRIMDTDMAEEMTEYTQQDVLAQAAISMMQRANERPESLLQLLQ